MTIDISQILEYLFCPVYYKLKSKGLHTSYIDSSIHYDNCLHKFVNAYNHKLNIDGSINYDSVKSIFSSLWIGTKTKEDYIFIETNSTNRSSKIEKCAIESVLNFHSFNTKYPYSPIMVDYRYKVPIDKNIELTGCIELIREIDEKIEVVDYISKAHFFSAVANFDNDLNAIAMAYAFKHIFKYDADYMNMYYFNKCEEKRISPKEDDFYKLKKTVVNIAKCIHNNIIYYQTNDRCTKCGYHSMCRTTECYNTIFERG